MMTIPPSRCGACKRRPEARRLGLPVPAARNARCRPRTDLPASSPTPSRALIRKIHGFVPAQQLLALLNERLACDLGPDAAVQHGATACRHRRPASPLPAGGHGWPRSVLIAQARRPACSTRSPSSSSTTSPSSSRSTQQVLVLRDTLLQPEEDA